MTDKTIQELALSVNRPVEKLARAGCVMLVYHSVNRTI